MLPAGICLCLMMPLVSGVSQLHTALILLSLAGALGGLMVVPLNALLQHRGCVLLSAGRSIAVQGFNENASILVMLAIYAALLAMDVSIVALMWGFGLVCAALLAWIMWRLRRPVTTS
jgi:MFS transporter, LPLT family, lysophospholipid transporter